ncbi:hypothetical protein GCM10008904_00660 [Paraclostridium ghonii]|uniref:Uncharacterized protein n=1 Tax=Paraclostridium ghonii TaxID=29358 RepID=A0ABU0N4A2_9FIRM|nr:hypothetical protein [Paeniclostridium ghonii]MDQ0557977.1 hypothetical protein [Paeniclostridium ghonii]
MRYIVESKKNYDVGYCYSCGWLVIALYRCTPQCMVFDENGCASGYCTDFRFH